MCHDLAVSASSFPWSTAMRQITPASLASGTARVCAGYVSVVLFSSWLPGQPAYAVEWRTLVETWHCSINFFYVNQVLNWVGVHLIESVAVSFTPSATCSLITPFTLVVTVAALSSMLHVP